MSTNDGKSSAPAKGHWAGKVVLIAVSVDESPDIPEKHLEAKGWNQTHNVWGYGDKIRAYGVNSLPTTYIISKDGMVVSAGHITEIAETVNPMVSEN